MYLCFFTKAHFCLCINGFLTSIPSPCLCMLLQQRTGFLNLVLSRQEGEDVAFSLCTVYFEGNVHEGLDIGGGGGPRAGHDELGVCVCFCVCVFWVWVGGHGDVCVCKAGGGGDVLVYVYMSVYMYVYLKTYLGLGMVDTDGVGADGNLFDGAVVKVLREFVHVQGGGGDNELCVDCVMCVCMCVNLCGF